MCACPSTNMLLGEEAAALKSRRAAWGPGRIHHTMRSIGSAQPALELMIERSQERKTFGKYLLEQRVVSEWIALSVCEIEQARLLTLRAAEKMDREGNKSARDMIAAAKVVVPSMAARVIDRAIQIHGAAGVSQDTFWPKPICTPASCGSATAGPGASGAARARIAEAIWDAGVI